jgi:hypothetical protein
MGQSPFENATVAEPIKEFPTFSLSRSFITMCTTAHARPIAILISPVLALRSDLFKIHSNIILKVYGQVLTVTISFNIPKHKRVREQSCISLSVNTHSFESLNRGKNPKGSWGRRISTLPSRQAWT